MESRQLHVKVQDSTVHSLIFISIFCSVLCWATFTVFIYSIYSSVCYFFMLCYENICGEATVIVVSKLYILSKPCRSIECKNVFCEF